MINALQITISFNEMELRMPGNVNMVMGYASDLASFNVFPTKAILGYFSNSLTLICPESDLNR